MNMAILIVGVPFAHLGKIKETEELINITNVFGEKLQAQEKLKRFYLQTPIREFYLGSNRDAIESKYANDDGFIPPVYLSLDDIFSDIEEQKKWVHDDDATVYNLDATIVGLYAPSYPDDGPYDIMDYQHIATMEKVIEMHGVVKEKLKTKFGYTGEILVIAEAI